MVQLGGAVCGLVGLMRVGHEPLVLERMSWQSDADAIGAHRPKGWNSLMQQSSDKHLGEEYRIDEEYYEVVRPNGLAERLLIKARDRIFQDFMAETAPESNSKILDVGVSNVVNDGANVLERNYPWPQQVTACGLGNAPEFCQAYPEVEYVQIEPGRALPFQEDTFDVATANAVLEHVGSLQSQRQFIGELLRVSKRVFISVPHRYFPIEHHTAIPLLHYTRPSFAFACAVTGKTKWADEAQLILMSRRALRRLVPQGIDFSIGYTGIRLGPLSSNIYLMMRRS